MNRLKILTIGEIASKTCFTSQRWYNHRRADYSVHMLIKLSVNLKLNFSCYWFFVGKVLFYNAVQSLTLWPVRYSGQFLGKLQESLRRLQHLNTYPAIFIIACYILFYLFSIPTKYKSKPPKPPDLFDEKTIIVWVSDTPSFIKIGLYSSNSVFILAPKFIGLLQCPFSKIL